MFGFKRFPECFESFAAVFPNLYESYRVYFCEGCHCSIGRERPNVDFECSIPECLSRKFDYFIVFPVEKQLRDTVLKYETEIEEYERTIRENNIADISQGRMYKLLESQVSSKLITLSVNTDGAAAYRWSGHKPCYPIFVTINNLPPRLRFSNNNLILAAVFGELD